MSGSHIAILLPDLRGGGVERLKINLSIEFLKRGYAVDFVLMQARGELMGLVPNGARVVDLETSRVRHVLWPLVRYLRRERPDALLAAMWPLTALPPLAVFLARTCTKVLASEHVDFRMTGSWSAAVAWLAKRMGRVAYGRTDAVVAVSAGVAESISVITGFHRDRIHVIHNAIRAPVVTLGQATDNPDALFFGSPRILTVGMLKPAKNQALLLRAFSALSSYPNAGLTIVGAGPNERKLKDLADSLGIATRVNFAGFHTDLTAFYRSADLFVLSSDYEGFGNVIAEALSYGLPVVSTDCRSGPAEILENGRWGRLVPVGNAGLLACAIEEALADHHDREGLMRRAADFAPEKAAHRYLSVMNLEGEPA